MTVQPPTAPRIPATAPASAPISAPIAAPFVPGATAAEVENRITRPVEKLLWEIPGVEYLYSTSRPGKERTVSEPPGTSTRQVVLSSCEPDQKPIASAAAQTPVPQDRVSPTPRS